MPRAHRKTTYATAMDALQIALPDDLGICPYPRNLGPGVRLGIVHETDLMASKILQDIKNWVSNAETLRLLFPDILPDLVQGDERRKMKDNESAFELNRKMKWKEATFETFSVGSRAQGRHYNRLKLDDIYGASARESQKIRQDTLQWFDDLPPFLDSISTDGFDLVGTRWDHQDVYAHAMDKYGEDLPRYIRSVIEWNEQYREYLPIFPEKFTLESLKHERKNRKTWTSFWLNAPDFRDNPELDPSWLRSFIWIEKNRILVVPAEQTIDGKRIKRHVSELERVLFIDPAIEGDAGWIITGSDHISNHPNVFVLEAERGPIPPPVFIQKVFNAVKKWDLRKVVIEEVLFSRLYKPWLEAEMRNRNFYFKVETVKTGQKEKDARVLGLAPFFQANQIFFCSQGQDALYEEYNQFGLGGKYHILDALAYGPQIWRSAVDRGVIERRAASYDNYKRLRNSLTGYTR